MKSFFRRKIEKGFALVRDIRSPSALAHGCSWSTDAIRPFLLGNNSITGYWAGYEGQHLGNQRLGREQRMLPVQKPSWVWIEEIWLPNIPKKIKNIWWRSGISCTNAPDILRWGITQTCLEATLNVKNDQEWVMSWKMGFFSIFDHLTAFGLFLMSSGWHKGVPLTACENLVFIFQDNGWILVKTSKKGEGWQIEMRGSGARG